jgi:hypothetical protein
MVAQQLTQLRTILEHWRLDDDIDEVLGYADVLVQQPRHHFLVVLDTAGHETRQLVVTAADQMAFKTSSNRRIIGLEHGEVFAAV